MCSTPLSSTDTLDNFARMKTLFYTAMVLGMTLINGPADDLPRLIESNLGKAVTFSGTTSPDGKYALGWTLKAKNSNVAPVDWSLWKPDDDTAFITLPQYNFDDDDPKARLYTLQDVIIDLTTQYATVLPSTFPYSPHKNNGDLHVLWSSEKHGPVYAVVVNDNALGTWDMWLVKADGALKIVQITDACNKAVDALLKAKKLPSSQYATTYAMDDSGTTVGSFATPNVIIPFFSSPPKEDTGITGSLTVRLEDGKIMKATMN